LAAALLAGSGVDEFALASPRRKTAMLLAPLALVALTPLASRLVPAGETGPLGLPQAIDLAGWLLPLAILALLAWLPGRTAWRTAGAAALAVVELFVAGWVLPYNYLTAPEAYTSIRPAMTQLLAAQPAPALGIASALDGGNLIASSSFVTTVTTSVATPQFGLAQVDPRLSLGVPARFLSMSALRFDPGDLAELRGELDPQLPADAVYDFVIATKNKEVLSPNLPLTWGLPAVDGYDGGVLPLRHYADFTWLFTGLPSPDGRLRENLTSAPDPRLLSLVNARYLVTDKVDDAWVNGVFYDLQFTLTLSASQSAQIAYVPTFRATALEIVAASYSGAVSLTFDDGTHLQLPITNYKLQFPGPKTPAAITFMGPLSLRGLSLVDDRTGAFQSLTLGPYRLVHSGDVKVYANLDLLPRAFVAPNAVVQPNDDQARSALADPSFNPATTVILADAPSGPSPAPAITATRPATITTYSPEQVQLTADGPGTLLLTDAYYPGWTATIDGAPAPIQRADIMFRALSLPPGQHQIEFRYDPLSVRLGLVISALAWSGLALALVLLRRRRILP
jgi:Bacterial membrane protein YfhO